VKPSSIRLYIKPNCGWCHEVMDWLEARGIDYERLNVSADDASFKEMVRLSGQTLAPVIDVDGEVLADFGADELESWWKEMGFQPA
jgi:arsenate reductase-like glutaredoxin family protein